jgi:propionyl-CoA carboxylase alpha chain
LFKKVLIANRGEIACRIVRSLRQLGVGSVAVFSDADRDAMHTVYADEAVAIGPAPSAQSYLSIDRLVDACLQTRADAVHPGYGFLSENSNFLKALDAAGIAFIGPGQRAIEIMGDKIAAKALARKAGISVIPGYDEALEGVDDALEKASAIGYPVMLKASAGGGGKGMRVAFNSAECREGFDHAQNEAQTSFGDNRVFIEKYIDRPRHIEIQVLGDHHGNCVYLHERECSIQRRHQKVIEEAPSTFIDSATRAAMGEQAIDLAKAVDYYSAGTVEFIVDQARNFYFLEMNTRLQVEHPVTEMITGLDLVELMLRIAAGEELPFTQSDVPMNGWAIESRIYAENPARGFVPATGRLIHYRQPPQSGSVRVDSGVNEGSEISIHYDPMVAKLICHGSDRDAAIALMRESLDQFHIQGVVTNVSFLASLLAHKRFLAGETTTAFIDEEYPEGFVSQTPSEPLLSRIIALIAVVHQRSLVFQWGESPASSNPRKTHVVRIAGAAYRCSVEPEDEGYSVRVDSYALKLTTAWTGAEKVTAFCVDGERYYAQVERTDIGYSVVHAGFLVSALILEPHTSELYDFMPLRTPKDQSHLLLSPMPGLLISIDVEAGDAVHAGQALAVIEAMKMENVLKAERDCVIETIHAAVGDTLEPDQPVIEFRVQTQ